MLTFLVSSEVNWAYELQLHRIVLVYRDIQHDYYYYFFGVGGEGGGSF